MRKIKQIHETGTAYGKEREKVINECVAPIVFDCAFDAAVHRYVLFLFFLHYFVVAAATAVAAAFNIQIIRISIWISRNGIPSKDSTLY